MSLPDIPDVGALLSELVATDTTNPGGSEHSAATVLADVFAAHAVDATVDDYGAGHCNLIAAADFGQGPTVMLNSHLDVVPATGEWSSPPFSPTLSEGRLYGRGSADAKGSLAPMAVALLRLVRNPRGLSGRVLYTAVGDEEVGSTGARHLLRTHRPDAAIVGEPTGLRLLTAHKGSVRPVIELMGRSSHAAAPENGVNAIEGLQELLNRLGRFAKSLTSRQHDMTGSPTLTAVLVEGGEAPNAVPASCRLTLDRRLVPGETAEGALSEIQAVLDAYNAECAPLVARVLRCAPSTGGPSETSRHEPFVQQCQQALALTGSDNTCGGLIVNCDMTHFRARSIPTVILGPGRLEAMHVVDEWVELAEVARAVDIYEAVLRTVLAQS